MQQNLTEKKSNNTVCRVQEYQCAEVGARLCVPAADTAWSRRLPACPALVDSMACFSDDAQRTELRRIHANLLYNPLDETF